MRVTLRQGSIAQGGRIGADQVGDHHLAFARGRASRPPLVGGGVSAPTASAQRGRRDLVDGALRPQLLDRALQAGIASMLSGLGQAARVDPADDSRQQALLASGQDPDLW